MSSGLQPLDRIGVYVYLRPMHKIKSWSTERIIDALNDVAMELVCEDLDSRDRHELLSEMRIYRNELIERDIDPDSETRAYRK